MGVEYIFLAMLSCTVFALMVFSFLFLYIYVSEQTSKIPNISIDLEVQQEHRDALINIIIRHKGGEVVLLKQLIVTTDRGIVKIDFENELNKLENVTVNLVGFKDNIVILPGSTAKINLRIPIDYFYSKGGYRCIVLFDKTEVSSWFNF